MCFTCSCTRDDDHSNDDLKDEQDIKLLQKTDYAGEQPPKNRRRSKLSSAYLSSLNIDTGTQVEQEVSESPAWRSSSQQESSPQFDTVQNKESLKKVVPSDKFFQSEFTPCGFENSTGLHRTVFSTAAGITSKMKNKQVKGMITGVGKELRRAASTVGEKIPTPARRKHKAEKERQDLLQAEPRKPQFRNPDEIKKAYGHATDTNYSVGMAHDKLRERGEKLSALQRRTADLESDAANFSNLTDQLVRKMESRKWYEI